MTALQRLIHSDQSLGMPTVASMRLLGNADTNRRTSKAS